MKVKTEKSACRIRTQLLSGMGTLRPFLGPAVSSRSWPRPLSRTPIAMTGDVSRPPKGRGLSWRPGLTIRVRSTAASLWGQRGGGALSKNRELVLCCGYNVSDAPPCRTGGAGVVPAKVGGSNSGACVLAVSSMAIGPGPAPKLKEPSAPAQRRRRQLFLSRPRAAALSASGRTGERLFALRVLGLRGHREGSAGGGGGGRRAGSGWPCLGSAQRAAGGGPGGAWRRSASRRRRHRQLPSRWRRVHLRLRGRPRAPPPPGRPRRRVNGGLGSSGLGLGGGGGSRFGQSGPG